MPNFGGASIETTPKTTTDEQIIDVTTNPESNSHKKWNISSGIAIDSYDSWNSTYSTRVKIRTTHKPPTEQQTKNQERVESGSNPMQTIQSQCRLYIMYASSKKVKRKENKKKFDDLQSQ